MSKNDQRSVPQIQKLDSPLQVNEIFRKLSASITQLEGRQGQITLKDGIHSTTTTQVAGLFDAETLRAAGFGIFFAGVDGTDCWLASGATLSPAAEWIATKTRATLLKFDNLTGGVFYFNTGLTIGTSFIPTPQSTPGLSPVYGQWFCTAFKGAAPITYTWDTEDHNEPSYFTRVAGNTQIQINKEGIYEVSTQINVLVSGGGQATIQMIVPNTVLGTFIGEVYGAAGTLGTVSLKGIATLHPGDLIEVDKVNGSADPGTIFAQSKSLSIKLLQS